MREAAFYTDKNAALQQLWFMLEERGISPGSCFGDHHFESNEGWQGAEDEQVYEDFDDEEYDDPTHSDDSPENDEIDVEMVGRRVEASRVLREVGILTRGNPRKVFERRVMRCLNTFEGQGVIEKYKAKNNRIRLVKEIT